VPSTNEHLERSRRNVRFAESFDLETTPYLDWVVTAYFYAALHLVDALLAQKNNLHPATHQMRSEKVRTLDYLKGIKTEYRDLKEHSENARYNLHLFTSQTVNGEVIPLYRAIEKHILGQLPPGGTADIVEGSRHR
jgi:uncharacterized protein (UPF0332 family)